MLTLSLSQTSVPWHRQWNGDRGQLFVVCESAVDTASQAHLWVCTPTHKHRHRADDSECLPSLGDPHVLASRVGSTRKQGPCLKVCLPLDPSAGVSSEGSVGLLSLAFQLHCQAFLGDHLGDGWEGGTQNPFCILSCAPSFWSSPHCCLGHSRHLCTNTFPLCRSTGVCTRRPYILAGNP